MLVVAANAGDAWRGTDPVAVEGIPNNHLGYATAWFHDRGGLVGDDSGADLAYQAAAILGTQCVTFRPGAGSGLWTLNRR